MKSTCYEILFNTFLRRDQVHFNLKFFYRNKTTPSSPSYFCICVFEGIPCTAKPPSCWKDLDELFDCKSSHYYTSITEKKFESFRFQTPTELCE